MVTQPAASSRETMCAIGGFVAGACVAGAAVFFSLTAPATQQQGGALRESNLTGASSYKFVDPLIAVSSGQQISPPYKDLQASVAAYINAQQKQGLTAASVNFRDTGNSQGFSVNPDQLYSPASLYKVPIMLAYYKLAQSDPSVLGVQLTYSGPDQDARENIKSNVQLQPGQSYSVESLIEHMIKYSDNNAASMLTAHLAAFAPGVLTATVADLGVPYGSTADFLKVGTYSIFFRALYNATYLSAEYSNKALGLLAETDFSQGIEAGVPNSVDVAHKFGDSNDIAANGAQAGYQLHDCGIVYYPKHPYLLCVMTKGTSIDELENTIADISRMVYQDIEHRYGAD